MSSGCRAATRARWACICFACAVVWLAHGPLARAEAVHASPPSAAPKARQANATHKTRRARTARRRREAKRLRSPQYRQMRAQWHAKLSDEPTVAEDTTCLVFKPVNTPDTFVLVPHAETGQFDDIQQAIAQKAFAHYKTGHDHPVDPRLLHIAYQIMTHFDAPFLRLVSGYRPTRATSRHSQGKAMDIVVPGVQDKELAEYAKTFEHVGVGLYNVSGFVHVDVRDESYFWTQHTKKRKRSSKKHKPSHPRPHSAPDDDH
jgi:hypothetical protein